MIASTWTATWPMLSEHEPAVLVGDRAAQEIAEFAERVDARQVRRRIERQARIASPSWAACARASGCAADGQAVDAQGRLADAHRHALAFLAAGADAGVELHVVADHGHARERIGAVADDGRALDRVLDLAVFDPVGFAGREHELAAR